MSELKPCPSCGSTNVAIHKDVHGNLLWWGECYDCDLSTKGCDTADQAVAAWNTRAESSALTAAYERNGNLSVELAVMTAERDQWKALFLNTMGQINNADDRNPMCPCVAIIFEAIQRMPK